MQRTVTNRLILQLGKANHFRNRKEIFFQSARALATIKEIFPSKTEFPTRHIGPRKTDVVSMLDLLGFKVGFDVFLQIIS
jgi:hypothetical protein